MMKLKSLVLTSHKWFENRSGLCVSRCCQLEPTLKRLNSTLERRRTSAAVSEWRDYFSEAWSSPPTRASYYQQSNVKVRTWCETCLAPRARLTSHPVRWNAVDRHQSFQQDWCTFVLIIEGWGSLFLPEWIHVWLENATFFRNCFIRDWEGFSEQRDSRLLCSIVFCLGMKTRWHSQKRNETSRGFSDLWDGYC